MSVIQFPNKLKEITEKLLIERDAINKAAGEDRKAEEVDILSSACYLYLINKLLDAGFEDEVKNETQKELLNHTFGTIQATIAAFYGFQTDYANYVRLVGDLREEIEADVVHNLEKEGFEVLT